MQSKLQTGRPHAGRAAVALCSAVLAALAAVAPAVAPVGAAAPHPARPAASHLASAVTETAKVTLGETSIAGPALIGIGGQQAGFDISWTGTDAAHHLNVRTGTGQLNFPNKTTFKETSPFAPALELLPTAGSPPSFALAWTGSDANHSLNVLGCGTTKLTLHESSIAGPALQLVDLNGTETFLLAWTGTDPNHSLNVVPITGLGGTSCTVGTKTVLPQFSSNAGPSLSGLVLGWSTRATQQLNFATSADGVHFTSALGSGLPETSAEAPQLFQTSATHACMAWTGTDPAHHLNVQCSAQFPQFPNPAQTKTVLPETALGAPGFVTSGFTTADIAWTGTDPAHHLNVATLQGL